MVIVCVALLLLGPDKLPEFARKLGASWRALKRLQERVESEVREVVPDLPSTSDIARIVRSPVNMLNELADRAESRDATSAPVVAESPTNEQAPSPNVVHLDYSPPARLKDRPSVPDDPSMN